MKIWVHFSARRRVELSTAKLALSCSRLYLVLLAIVFVPKNLSFPSISLGVPHFFQTRTHTHAHHHRLASTMETRGEKSDKTLKMCAAQEKGSGTLETAKLFNGRRFVCRTFYWSG